MILFLIALICFILFGVTSYVLMLFYHFIQLYIKKWQARLLLAFLAIVIFLPTGYYLLRNKIFFKEHMSKSLLEDGIILNDDFQMVEKKSKGAAEVDFIKLVISKKDKYALMQKITDANNYEEVDKANQWFQDLDTLKQGQQAILNYKVINRKDSTSLKFYRVVYKLTAPNMSNIIDKISINNVSDTLYFVRSYE